MEELIAVLVIVIVFTALYTLYLLARTASFLIILGAEVIILIVIIGLKIIIGAVHYLLY